MVAQYQLIKVHLKYKWIFLIGLIVLSSCRPIETQRQPSTIRAREIWGPGVITLDHDVYVMPEGTLEILPGSIIRLIEGSVIVPDPAGDLYRPPKLVVEGTLICEGNASAKIRLEGANSHDLSYALIEMIRDSSQSDSSMISWTELGSTRWIHGRACISHSNIDNVSIEYCKEVVIDSNQLGHLFIIAESGTIKNNLITSGIVNVGGSLIIKRNIIKNLPGEVPGIRCSHDSRSIIIENLIDNCPIGIYIFSATPEIHRNNIVNNKINMVIMPEYQNPEFDTLDATDNWWGVADSLSIAKKIEYRKNGGTESGKVVKFIPYALQPFE